MQEHGGYIHGMARLHWGQGDGAVSYQRSRSGCDGRLQHRKEDRGDHCLQLGLASGLGQHILSRVRTTKLILLDSLLQEIFNESQKERSTFAKE